MYVLLSQYISMYVLLSQNISMYVLVSQYHRVGIIELVDSISRDEPDSPLTQYITNAGISLARYIHYHAF